MRTLAYRTLIDQIESIVAREREFAFDAEGALATRDQDWESLLPPEERSSRLTMFTAADDYFAMFAAAPGRASDAPRVRAASLLALGPRS